MSEPIHFCGTDGPFGFLSNFYEATFEIEGKEWKSTEHFFQAQKFASDLEYFETIRDAPTPTAAKALGSVRRPGFNPSWNSVSEDVMKECNLAKFSQNDGLKQKLLETGDRELVEHAADKIWGDGLDGSGANKLGRVLMAVRSDLR